MLENIKACLFDLDGTLVDSMYMWKEIDIAFLNRFQIPLPEHLQQDIEGRGFTETAIYFKERFALPLSVEEIKACWNQMAYQKYAEEVTFKPGAYAFLKKCRAMGLKLGICTSNSRELIGAVGGHLQFLDMIDVIVTSCEVKAGKPAPDVYLEAAARLGVKPEHCLVFEDLVAGITAGHSAGMKVCAVEDYYSADQREEKRRLSDYYIEDFRSLI